MHITRKVWALVMVLMMVLTLLPAQTFAALRSWPSTSSINVSSPTSGGTVSGTMNIVADVADAQGVREVRFTLNGTRIGTVSGSNLTDNQGPGINIQNPADGQTVNTRVFVTASANDNFGVTRMEVRFNGTLCGTASAGYINTYCDATGYPTGGMHAVTATAWDAAGRSASQYVAVYLDSGGSRIYQRAADVLARTWHGVFSGAAQVATWLQDNIGTSAHALVNGYPTSGRATLSYNTTQVPNDPSANLRIDVVDGSGNIVNDNIAFAINNGYPPGNFGAPNPALGATGVSLGTSLNWSDSANATSYDVYFGTASNPPFLRNVSQSSLGASAMPTLAYGTRYYWRVVAKNAVGTQTSSVWNFTTAAQPDTTRPTVGLIDPTTNDIFDGTKVFMASANDDRRVTSASFALKSASASTYQPMTQTCTSSYVPVCYNGTSYVNECHARENGITLGYSSGLCNSTDNPVYALRYDTNAHTDGKYTFRFSVSDAAGNSRTATADFSIDHNAPSLSITAPSNNSFAQETINITANANDTIGVKDVRFFIDDALIGSADTTAPYSASLNTTRYSNGVHTIKAIARDDLNHATTRTIQITIDNGDPVVSITSPASGATVSGDFTAQATATDANGIEWVRFYLNPQGDPLTLVTTDSVTPYSTVIDSTQYGYGSYTLTVRARDRAGNESERAINLTLDNRPPDVTMTLSPSSRTVTLGDTIPVDILIDTDGNNVVSALAVLQYNTSQLSVDSIDVSNTDFPVFVEETRRVGELRIGRGTVSGSNYNGSRGLLARVNFKADDLGTANVNLAFTGPGQGPSRVIEVGQTGRDLLLSVSGASYTVGAATTADINGDGRVDIIDVGILLSNWQNTGANTNGADLNNDGVVDIIDLGTMLSNYTG